jgi:hypothetical protein
VEVKAVLRIAYSNQKYIENKGFQARKILQVVLL